MPVDLLSVAKHSQQRKCKYHYSNQALEETPLGLSYLTVAYSPGGFPPYMLVTGFVLGCHAPPAMRSTADEDPGYNMA